MMTREPRYLPIHFYHDSADLDNGNRVEQKREKEMLRLAAADSEPKIPQVRNREQAREFRFNSPGRTREEIYLPAAIGLLVYSSAMSNTIIRLPVAASKAQPKPALRYFALKRVVSSFVTVNTAESNMILLW
jgi:hypothetical protein